MLIPARVLETVLAQQSPVPAGLAGVAEVVSELL